MTCDDDLRRYMSTALFILTAWSLLCLFLSAVVGCRTSKHITNDHEAQDSLSVVVNNIRFDKKWFEQLKNDSAWVNDYWNIKLYDTAHPVDAATNLPPLLADVTHKREQGKKTEEKTIQADTAVMVSQADTTVTHYENDTDIEDVQRETPKIPAWRVWLFLAFIVLAILMVRFGKGFIYKITTSLLNKIFK